VTAGIVENKQTKLHTVKRKSSAREPCGERHHDSYFLRTLFRHLLIPFTLQLFFPHLQ